MSKVPTGSNAASYPGAEPEYARIPETCRRHGLSRSGIYRLYADRKIRLVKLGRTTLVDMVSVRAFMATLPQA